MLELENLYSNKDLNLLIEYCFHPVDALFAQ